MVEFEVGTFERFWVEGRDFVLDRTCVFWVVRWVVKFICDLVDAEEVQRRPNVGVHVDVNGFWEEGETRRWPRVTIAIFRCRKTE